LYSLESPPAGIVALSNVSSGNVGSNPDDTGSMFAVRYVVQISGENAVVIGPSGEESRRERKKAGVSGKIIQASRNVV
jgi:hypothetical protein